MQQQQQQQPFWEAKDYDPGVDTCAVTPLPNVGLDSCCKCIGHKNIDSWVEYGLHIHVCTHRFEQSLHVSWLGEFLF
jgi:hypothetical protein